MVPLAPIARLEDLECAVSAACLGDAGRPGAALDIAGGKAMFVGPDSPMNSVKGVGLRTPVTTADLDKIADFFRSRACKAPVTFDACPFADDSLTALISQRAWPFAGFEQVLWRSISSEVRPDSAPSSPTGLTPVEIDRSGAEEWAMLLARIFSGQDDPPRWQVEIGLRGFDVPGGSSWAVLHEGRMIAAARSLIHGGAAHFSGAAVLPAFRNRGLQVALLRARLEHARAHHCDLAKTDTKPGTTSQRNAHRCGFHVAYTRAQFMMPVA